MNTNKSRWGVLLFMSALLLMLNACSDQTVQNVQDTGVQPEASTGQGLQGGSERWYQHEQVTLGKTVYEANCIGCHLENAIGTQAWKKALPDGSYPPPPLNGSAHAWHHSVEVLMTVINKGGAPYGGNMPAFENVLNDAEKLAVIAYFQSLWSDDIFGRWQDMNANH